MFTTYTGERVRLRPWRDVDELNAYTFDQQLPPPPVLRPSWYSTGHETALFDNGGGLDPHGICAFAIEELSSGEAIGFEACCFLSQAPLAAEVGTGIRPAWRGRGLGVEAKRLALCFLFENFPLERIGGYTMHTHQRSRRGLELLGLHYEGTLRCAYFSAGQWVDLAYYVIFREQWEGMAYRHRVNRGN